MSAVVSGGAGPSGRGAGGRARTVELGSELGHTCRIVEPGRIVTAAEGKGSWQ